MKQIKQIKQLPNLFAFIVSALVFFTGIAVADDDARQQQRFIAVQGKAEIEASPDIAYLTLTVFSEKPKLNDAKRVNDKKLQKLLDLLADMGIAKSDIHSQGTRIAPRYEYIKRGGRRLIAYNVTQNLQITMRKPDDIGILLEKAVAVGIDRIGQIRYDVKNREELKEKAMLQAVSNARSKAEKMAKELDVSLGGVISVSEAGQSYRPPVIRHGNGVMMMESAKAMGGVTPPEGEVKVSYSVNLRFAID